MDVLVLASQKGGAGKTTLTGHLAVAAVNQGLSPVVVIDTDPQGSLSSWWNRRQAETPAISVLPSLQALPERLEELRRNGAAWSDTPPAITNTIRGAMRVADAVRPSPHDLDAIGATIDLARQAEVEFVFVLTQAKLNARVTPQAVALLSAHGTVASSITQDRVIYATAMTDGRTAVDIEPRGAAAAEIMALWHFLKERTKDGQKGRRKGV